MAFQPEITNYDTGIYQLELTDPVQGGVGGVSNTPLLSLANRTNWLYTNLNLLIAGTTIPSTVAPLNSPNFSGTPTTPTPPLGDSSLKIANTAWVQSTISGVLNLSVAGGSNVSLSAVQAGNGTLKFTGALTANIAVLLPNATGKWVVSNNTTGPFTLTVKTAAGTGVAVTQGKTQTVYGDATNVYLQSNDFSSVVLTGVPTAPTPPLGDNSTKLATTAFLVNAFGSSLASSGYQKLPSGLIIQWGLTAIQATGTALTTTFPISFPNNCLSATATYALAGATSAAAGSPFVIKTLAATGITTYNGGPGNAQYYFFAIGS